MRGDIMEKYSDKLCAYLDANPIKYAEGDSLLEELYWCYIESNPFDSTELQKQFWQIYKGFPELTPDRFDEMFTLINDIGVQQEKLAFQTGVKIGFRLATELVPGGETPIFAK